LRSSGFTASSVIAKPTTVAFTEILYRSFRAVDATYPGLVRIVNIKNRNLHIFFNMSQGGRRGRKREREEGARAAREEGRQEKGARGRRGGTKG